MLKIEDGPQNWNKVKMKASEGYRLKKKCMKLPEFHAAFKVAMASWLGFCARHASQRAFPSAVSLVSFFLVTMSWERGIACVCLLAEPGPRGRIKGMEGLHNIKKDFLITGVVFSLEVVDPPSLETMTALLSGGLTQHCAMEIYYSPYMQF